MSTTNEQLYYIQNEGFCGNALFWWGANSRGYVTDIRKAGKYTKEQAERICQREEDHAYPCEYIDNLLEAQKLIIDTQYVDRQQEVKFEKKSLELKEINVEQNKAKD